MEDVGIFYGHLVKVRSFGTFNDHLVYFHPFWYIFLRSGLLHQEKSGNPALDFAPIIGWTLPWPTEEFDT
jgi:hypothetical protein